MHLVPDVSGLGCNPVALKLVAEKACWGVKPTELLRLQEKLNEARPELPEATITSSHLSPARRIYLGYNGISGIYLAFVIWSAGCCMNLSNHVLTHTNGMFQNHEPKNSPSGPSFSLWNKVRFCGTHFPMSGPVAKLRSHFVSFFPGEESERVQIQRAPTAGAIHFGWGSTMLILCAGRWGGGDLYDLRLCVSRSTLSKDDFSNGGVSIQRSWWCRLVAINGWISMFWCHKHGQKEQQQFVV